MTAAERIELATWLVAQDWWEWRRGMVALGRKDDPVAWFRLESTLPKLHGDWASAVPDLTDPATGGALLWALMRWCLGESTGLRVLRIAVYQGLDGSAEVAVTETVRELVGETEGLLVDVDADHLAEACALALREVRS